MKRSLLCLGLIAPIGLLWACSGDDDVYRATDAGTVEASTNDQSSPSDGGPPGDQCGDVTGVPPRVLLVQQNPGKSELAAVNLETNAVDGRLTFDGGYGFTSSLGSDPWLLGGESDVVMRLDAREPWKTVASWDVHGDDGVAGGDSNANPVAIAQVACHKAYVLRYNRDRIAVIDPTNPKAGVTKWIDLSSLKQPGDPNMLEVTSAVYVPSKRRVYVLLGNIDFTKYVNASGKLLCTTLKPSIIAIDVETDQVVSLGGSAPGGGIALEGYNPPVGVPLVYDAAKDRLLVLQAGCNADLADGGAGDMTRRRVEEVSLASGEVKTLLSLDDRSFPSSLAFASSEQAALAFYFDGYHWDPRQTTLGEAIPTPIDVIATDGRGAFVGAHQPYLDDGGLGPFQVVAVPTDDAGTKVVTQDPFTKPGGFVTALEAWPHQ